MAAASAGAYGLILRCVFRERQERGTGRWMSERERGGERADDDDNEEDEESQQLSQLETSDNDTS